MPSLDYFTSADGSTRCKRCQLHPDLCPCKPRNRAERRGPVIGFVGADGKTHGEKGLRGGITKLAACGRVEKFWPVCAANPASAEVPFIANPKAPLCLRCVAAIEDELTGENR